MKFTLEEEKDKKLNFLDITISKEQNIFSVDIFRKPTTTDVIIPNDSYHPIERKLAAIRYFYKRMTTYILSPDNLQKENIKRQYILVNNNYDTSISKKASNKKNKTSKQQNGQNLHMLENKRIYH
jgi:hypothetical protein